MKVERISVEDSPATPPSLEKHLTTWPQRFLFRGKKLCYNRLPHNNRSERAVEIPLAFDFLAARAARGGMLEVGNVLRYYENTLSEYVGIKARRIVDKFEVGAGIDNIDVLELSANQPYHTIVSISTMEHVGQGSDPLGNFGEGTQANNLEGPLQAIAKLYELLAPAGRALVTVPFGKLIDGGWYIQFSAEYLDLLVSSYGIPKEALSVSFLKLIAREPRKKNPHQIWEEVPAEAVRNVRYDTIRGGARAIAVLELTKLPDPFTLNLNVPPTPLAYERSRLARNMIITLGSLLQNFK